MAMNKIIEIFEEALVYQREDERRPPYLAESPTGLKLGVAAIKVTEVYLVQ